MHKAKKAALILGACGFCTGVAWAQSSVEIYGVLDIGLQRVSNGTTTLTSEMTNGNSFASRLGFRGTEDLGAGWKAKFVLESGLTPDTGAQADAARFFNRMSFLALEGPWGGVRLGHDYTPTYVQLAGLDPFGTNGVAKILTFVPSFSNQTTTARTDNGIQYRLPPAPFGISGLSGEWMYAFNESTSSTTGNRYSGGRLAYVIGPVTLSTAHGETKVTAVDGESTVKETYLGGKLNLNGNTFALNLGDRRLGSDKRRFAQIAAVVPVTDVNTIKVAAVRYTRSGQDRDAAMLGLGFTHDMSKRTQLYGTFSRLHNESASALGLGSLAGVAGKSVSALEGGVRHSF